MSNNRFLSTNTYYHVFNRGYNKQTLFFNPKDYARFYDYLIKFTSFYPSIQIKAHCILPNHFHFLLLETGLNTTETGLNNKDNKAISISHFMRKLQVSYSMYFNRTYGDKIKKGLKSPVFEGRFKAKEVLDEAYLAQLVTYVEMNAVKHQLVNQAEDWPYSSYRDTNTGNSLEDDFFADFETGL